LLAKKNRKVRTLLIAVQSSDASRTGNAIAPAIAKHTCKGEKKDGYDTELPNLQKGNMVQKERIFQRTSINDM